MVPTLETFPSWPSHHRFHVHGLVWQQYRPADTKTAHARRKSILDCGDGRLSPQITWAQSFTEWVTADNIHHVFIRDMCTWKSA